MLIYLTGASGFVGSHLKGCVALHRGEMPLEKADVVIHLAGENIAGRRWCAAQKKAIYDSRILGTRQLVHHLIEKNIEPDVFISASAVGFYGDRGDEVLTEANGKGAGFLADVCQDWEAASKDLIKSRVCHTRFGMVISKDGGAVKKLLPVFKMGLGGRIGSGEQYMSWIEVKDLARAMDHVIRTDSLSGPINFCSPQPVRNKTFTGALARSLHRWVGPPLPAWAARLLFGEMADSLLLASQRAIPEKLTQSGFTFETPTIQEALA